MSKTIRKYNKFQYPLADLECRDCLYNNKKRKKRGCGFAVCRNDDMPALGHIKRKRGRDK